jgi:hypothetical protein
MAHLQPFAITLVDAKMRDFHWFAFLLQSIAINLKLVNNEATAKRRHAANDAAP